jgi:hypothetical protein
LKVKQLIALLQQCDPEAFVSIGLDNIRTKHVKKLVEAPAHLLYFFIDQRNSASYSGYEHHRPSNEVALVAGLSRDVLDCCWPSDDPDIPDDVRQAVAPFFVPPDFQPDSN